MPIATPLQSELAYYFHVLVKELEINKPYYTAKEISTYLEISDRSVFSEIAKIRNKCNKDEAYKNSIIEKFKNTQYLEDFLGKKRHIPILTEEQKCERQYALALHEIDLNIIGMRKQLDSVLSRLADVTEYNTVIVKCLKTIGEYINQEKQENDSNTKLIISKIDNLECKSNSIYDILIEELSYESKDNEGDIQHIQPRCNEEVKSIQPIKWETVLKAKVK